jgi:hypothetical protein
MSKLTEEAIKEAMEVLINRAEERSKELPIIVVYDEKPETIARVAEVAKAHQVGKLHLIVAGSHVGMKAYLLDLTALDLDRLLPIESPVEIGVKEVAKDTDFSVMRSIKYGMPEYQPEPIILTPVASPFQGVPSVEKKYRKGYNNRKGHTRKKAKNGSRG